MSKRGEKAFNRCNVKVVELIDYEFPSNVKADDISHAEGYIALKDGTLGTRTRIARHTSGGGYSAGNEAILHCPRTEDERVNVASQFDNHESRSLALDSVRQLAGALLCEHCRYSTMTPVEVTLERARIAKAEAELLENQALRAQALKELSAIDPAYRHIE